MKLFTTLNIIREHSPCSDSWQKALKLLGKTKADDEPLSFEWILENLGLDDALWGLRAVSEENETERDRLARIYACDCAERVLVRWDKHYPEDHRPKEAICAAAMDAFRAAACAASWAAACAAARDAARAAACAAACAAARDAARGAARDAACAAACAAARDAACAAACAAARDAARAAACAAACAASWAAACAAACAAARDAACAAACAAARDAACAARDAEEKEQIKLFKKYFCTEEVAA